MTRLSSYFLPTLKEAPADAEAASHRLLVRAGLARQLARRALDLPARGLAGAPQGRAGDSRGAERHRGARAADARAASGRALEAERALRHRRALQARGPPRGGAGAGHDPRGGHHLAPRARDPLLPRPAADALPLPGQGARRAPPARRPAAYARVHHEGLVQLRPRRGGAGPVLRAAHPGLRPHVRPLRPRVVPRRVGRRDDGRARRARVHGTVRRGRERGRARRRLRRQHGDRERRASAGRRSAGAPGGTGARRDAGRHDDRTGLRDARRAGRRPDQGDPGGRRGARSGPGRRARRPSPERVQAPERARRSRPAGRRGRGAGAVRDGGRLHRTGGRNGRGGCRRGAAWPRWARGRRKRSRPPPARRGAGARLRATWADIRRVEEGDAAPGGGRIRIEAAIEVGNIFKLGTRYSEPLGLTYLDEQGNEQLVVMGSLRARPGSCAGRRDRAVRGRAGNLLAARASRPSTSSS